MTDADTAAETGDLGDLDKIFASTLLLILRADFTSRPDPPSDSFREATATGLRDDDVAAKADEGFLAIIFASGLAADFTFDDSRDFVEERADSDLAPRIEESLFLKESTFLDKTFVFTARRVFWLTGI